MTYNDCVMKAMQIMLKRADYWELQYSDLDKAMSYRSCADILSYAIEGNWEALEQFDYYGEEVEGEVK